MSFPSRRVRRLVLRPRVGLAVAGVAVLSGIGMLGVSVADVKVPGSGESREVPHPAPVAHSMVIDVVRGKSVEVTLKALTERTLGLEFEIRGMPGAGVVTKPTRLPREAAFDRATVIYRSDPDSTAMEDRFVFVARLPDGPVSAPATVTVRISEPQPVLELLNSNVRLGRVLIGRSSSAILVLRNVGSAPFRRELEAAPPWMLRLPGGELVIAPGETARLTVEYEPRAPGDDRLELPLEAVVAGDKREAMLVVEAQAVAPFEAAPPLLRLDWNGESRTREGVLRLRNVTAEALTIFIEAPTAVEIPREVAVGPLEAKDLSFSVRGGPGAYEAEVTLAGAGYHQVVALEGLALPPHIELVEPPADGEAMLQLPTVEQGTEAWVDIPVMNGGGEAGEFIAEATTPFRIHAEDAAFHLESGARRIVRFGLASSVIGPFEGSARFFCGQELLSIPLHGEVTPPKTPQTTDDSPGRVLLDAHRDGRPMPPIGESPVAPADPGDTLMNNPAFAEFQAVLFQRGISIPREYTPLVPSVAAVGMHEQKREEITLAWQPPGPGDYGYVVEYERMFYVPKVGQMYKLWVPYPQAEVRRDGDRFLARVTGLKPGSVYSWRVLTEEPGVGVSLPSKPVRLGTLLPWRLPWRWVISGGLLLLLIGLWTAKKRLAG